jgi:hypothetical protein
MGLRVLSFFRRHSHAAAGVAATSLVFMLLATCLMASDMTPEQKACCASMHGDCDMAIASPCCAGQSHAYRGVVAAKPTTMLAAVAMQIALLPPSVLTMDPSARLALTTPAVASSPPGIPTYLFVSSFRI